MTGLMVLVGLSLLLWLVFAGLAVARKVRRDRREARSADRRTRYEASLFDGDHAAMVAMAQEARRSIEAQVDLAISIDTVHRTLSRGRIAEIGSAAEESGLVPTLLKELRARSPVTRGRAALLLTRPGIPTVVEVVTPLLTDKDPDVRLVACSGLARVGTPEAAKALIWGLMARALPPERIIERLGAPWAVETMLQTLHEGPPPAPPIFGDVKAQGHEVALNASLARALGIAEDPRAEMSLIALLRTGPEEVQVSAARALGRCGRLACIPALIAALDSDIWPVRAQATKSLGALQAVEALPELEQCLADRAWWVRANSARALRALGDPGIAALRRALDHHDRYARDRAREQLALHDVIEERVAA